MQSNKEPIRVAHIMGKWVGGGVEAVVMNYYRHIDRNKIQFDFICDDDSTNIPYEEIEKLDGKVILIPPYQKVFEYQRQLKNIFKENKYQIVHSHINTLSVFPLRAAKKAEVPIRIAHSHSTTNKNEKKKNLMKQILKPFSKLYATNYFACTEHAGRWLFGNKVFDEGKVFIMNNAIDLNKFKYKPEVRKLKRNELGIKDEQYVIGHIGRFVSQKNHSFIIDIFKEVSANDENAILVLVGQGPLQDEIRKKVVNLGLKDKVKFLGQVDDIEKLYQVFDLFLFPSLYEGLGMVLIEAQCSGLPCIVSTEVPSIAKVTELVDFLELSENQKFWSKKVLSTKIKNRTNHFEKIKEAGYDIKKESTFLVNEYHFIINKKVRK